MRWRFLYVFLCKTKEKHVIYFAYDKRNFFRLGCNYTGQSFPVQFFYTLGPPNEKVLSCVARTGLSGAAKDSGARYSY
jgi:hypothetical protein